MHDERLQALKDESLPQLLRDLTAQTTTLVRQEIDLAKVELNAKVKEVTGGAVMFGAAAVFGVGAFGALTVVLIALLALVLPLWAAALIVTIVYAVGALIAVQRGRGQLVRATPVVPQQTAQSVKEDIERVKTRAQSGMKS